MTGRRVVTALVVALAVAVVTVAAAGAGGADSDDDYLVRAIFDNASFVIPGEDVKVSGVTVGTIDAVDITDDNKAVVVLRIDDPAFRPFRQDASCRVRLQSLIGEQFVECDPTRRRGDAVQPAPPLEEIAEGPGAGEYLLPLENTSSPVGIDLINNIMRLPQRERFRIILNELGVGLAANGEALNAAIRRASPVLQEADRLVSTLADQTELLDRLVAQSDAVLEPLARRREELGGFIAHAGETATATAARGDDLERNFERFPAFLRELGPAVERYGALAEEMGPAVANLAAEAPAVNESVQRLGPFTKASVPALETLGDVADRGRQTFPAIEPLADDLRSLSKPLAPLAQDLGALASSFDEAGGVEDLMRFIYFYTGATNGVNELGHYIRSAFAVSACSARISQPAPGCESTFDSSGGSGGAARAARTSPVTDPDAGAIDEGSERLLEYLLADGDATP